jgi:membrane associated rhomboid family serine protease
MSTLWSEMKLKVMHSGSRINLLIGINVVLFLAEYVPAAVENLVFHSDHIHTFTEDYLRIPSYLPKLLHHFWTPLTYMFLHAGYMHIIFNMLWLYWMGQIFEEYLGNKRTIGVYLLGGLTGGFFFVLFYNVFPLFTQTAGLVEGSTTVGASAAVMSIVVATATLLPDYTISMLFIGPVRLKWVALVIVIIDFLGVTGLNAGGELSHLGGALFGFVYVKQLQRGHDWVGFFTNLFKKRSKLKVVASNGAKKAGNAPRQEEIDRILDKISQSGYDSLNKQEKEILFRASKDNES